MIASTQPFGELCARGRDRVGLCDMNVESGSQWSAFSDGAWNLADIWESHAIRFPSATALICDDRRITWAEMDQRADGIAQLLLANGLQQQDKVAHYLYNCPEYIESMFAMFKAGLVQVNTNYRYTDDETGLPVGQRRRRGCRLPRLVRPHNRTDPPRTTEHRGLDLGRRRFRPHAFLGGPVRTCRSHPSRPAARSLGEAAMISTSSTPVGPRVNPRA